jgi:DegV family protein with EDD domain
MSQIRVVTDSTSDIPPEMAEELGISVIPCYINFGAESFLDQVELSRSEFYRLLTTNPAHPTTAAPPPGMFAEVYRELLDRASGIVSIHPSDHLSALRQSALNGWDMVNGEIPFRALDAGQISMGLGWIAVRAAQAAAAGESMASIEALVTDLRKRVHLIAALDTIEYLQRSGRVGWARGAIGKLLRVRPVIKLYQGDVTSEGYVRTRKSAFKQLSQYLEALGELECLTILHSNAPQLADQFQGYLAQLPLPKPTLTINATPILGTHVGPDGVGFVAIKC